MFLGEFSCYKECTYKPEVYDMMMISPMLDNTDLNVISITLFIYCKHCHVPIKKKRENFVSNHHSYCKRAKWVTFLVCSANTILGDLLNKKLLLFIVINCRFPDICWPDVVGIWFTCTFLFDYNTWLYSFKLTQ